jgi:hypothetical protein
MSLCVVNIGSWMYRGSVGFIQRALWILEQYCGICQLVGCFVSSCVVDIGIVGVVDGTLIRR